MANLCAVASWKNSCSVRRFSQSGISSTPSMEMTKDEKRLGNGVRTARDIYVRQLLGCQQLAHLPAQAPTSPPFHFATPVNIFNSTSSHQFCIFGGTVEHRTVAPRTLRNGFTTFTFPPKLHPSQNLRHNPQITLNPRNPHLKTPSIKEHHPQIALKS